MAGRLRVLDTLRTNWHIWGWSDLGVELQVVGLQHAVVAAGALGGLALLCQYVTDTLPTALVLRV